MIVHVRRIQEGIAEVELPDDPSGRLAAVAFENFVHNPEMLAHYGIRYDAGSALEAIRWEALGQEGSREAEEKVAG